jgi:hypothetical protein
LTIVGRGIVLELVPKIVIVLVLVLELELEPILALWLWGHNQPAFVSLPTNRETLTQRYSSLGFMIP